MRIAIEQREIVTTTTVRYTFYVYKHVVHVVLTIKVARRKPYLEEWLITRKYYEANKHKRSPTTWAKNEKSPHDPKRSANIQIATQEYLTAYQHAFWEHTEDKPKYFPLSEGMLDEYWEHCGGQIVDDQSANNGFIYDLNGKPIYRGFKFDYIGSHIGDQSHYVDRVLQHLKNHREVEQVKLVDIPYCNRHIGDKGIEFLFMPSKRYFTRLINAHRRERHFTANSYGIKDMIFRKLGLKSLKFRQPATETERNYNRFFDYGERFVDG